MSTDEHFKNLRKTLSVTASALLNSQNVTDTIFSSKSPYKTLLKSTLADNSINSSTIAKLKGKGLSLGDDKKDLFQDIYSSNNGEKYFDNKYTDKKSSFRILSYINDDILNDISDEDSNRHINHKRLLQEGSHMENEPDKVETKGDPSLFEGFQATVNTDLRIKEDISDESQLETPLLQNIQDAVLTVPKMYKSISDSISLDNIKPNDIKNSTSLNFLADLFNNVLQRIDNLEIKKNITSTEINELESKLNHLKVRRDLMFNRIVNLEENQFQLENNLNIIKDRMSHVKEARIDTDPLGTETSQVLSKKIDDLSFEASSRISHHFPSTRLDTKIGELDPINKPKYSIDHSVRENILSNPIPDMTKLQQFFQPKNKKYRKTAATLQQYYPVGTKIYTLPKCHETSISCLDFDVPFGILCTAGDVDHTIKIWDQSKHIEIGRMDGHLATINCMEMDTAYNMLVTGSKDATIKLWNIGNAIEQFSVAEDTELNNFSDVTSCVHSFESHVDEVTALSINSNTLVSASQDRTIRIWDIQTGNCTLALDIDFASIAKNISSHSTSSTTLHAPVTGALQAYDVALATGTKDGLIRLWDLRLGEVVRTLSGHTDAITSLRFDVNNIVSGSLDKSVRIWDLRSGDLFDAFSFESPVMSLDFDKHKVVVATTENIVRVFDRDEHKHWYCGQDINEGSLVRHVRYKDGYLVDGRSDGDINIWAI